MDNLRLRAIIIRIQDRLSEDDRRRLHFFFGNSVPRRIRDDPTLGGTLLLIESLFDQDKINEHDFTLLIEAFQQIKCFDAAQLLREYKQQSQLTETNSTLETLSSVLPQQCSSLSEECQEDKVAFHHLTTYDTEDQNQIKPSAPEEPQIQLKASDTDERKSLCEFCSTKICAVGMTIFTIVLLAAVVTLAVALSVSQSEGNKNLKHSLERLNIPFNLTDHTTTKTTTTTTDPRGFWVIGTTCGCPIWCKKNDPERPFGVCGDGHTCICRAYPVTKVQPEEGCTCDSWCQERGYPKGGICGDGYTCICS